jgi:PAS domain S-box-containing protein
MAGELTPRSDPSLDWLVGGGETGESMRALDWSRTVLGPLGAWPTSLRTATGIALGSSLPTAIAWGPSGALVYNEAYAKLLGARHPSAMGQGIESCWSSGWPGLREAWARARSGHMVSIAPGRVTVERGGRREDAAILGGSFGPIRDESGAVVGVLHTFVEADAKGFAVRMPVPDEEGELRFREIADAAPAMLWITDAGARCTFLSRGWCEYTGQTQAEGLGFAWTRAIHPGDRERAASEFATASERRQPFALDYRLRRSDGEYRWVIDAARPRFGADGRFTGYVGSVIDVHERTVAEEALRAREELVRTIAENSTQALVMLDDRGYCTYANKAWLRMTGYDAEEIRAAPLHALVHHHHPDGRPYPIDDCPINRALPDNKAVRAHEDVFFRKDGTSFPVTCAASPIHKDGSPVSTVLEVRDITASKQAERALRRQGEHLGLLWETAAVIVTSEDPDTMLGRIFARIREGLELDAYFHFIVDESGKALRRASYGGIEPEQADRVARVEFGEGLSGTIALERRPIVATAIQRAGDPRAKLLEELGFRTFAGNPLIASGRLLGTLAFASRRRDAFRPDELEFLETISHYVTAAYEQFRLIEKLRDADRKKDEFLATLAHELRNPLAPIRTGLRVLRLSRGDSATAEQSLAIMERQSAQLTRLIDDLLDVSRITQGKLQVRKSYVELEDVVQNALETARPFIDEARHDLEVTLPAEAVLLFADLTRLAQVLANLLSNAAKYTSRGGRIELVARREASEVVIRVRDNGHGIEAHMLERVFDKFTQIDRSPEPAYTGLGIGLTLVKSLVEMHGGTVTVRSDGLGTGSEFTVRLPCVVGRFEVPAVTDASVVPARPARGRRVLVVDDNQDAAELLSVAVEMLGHEVRTAHDGVEAIEVARAFRPAIVLMDLGMPRMNGYEAARRIRETPWGKPIVLVALTGWGQEADKRKTREAGFDHHLVKPAEPATLEAILGGDLDDP